MIARDPIFDAPELRVTDSNPSNNNVGLSENSVPHIPTDYHHVLRYISHTFRQTDALVCLCY